MTHRGVVTSVIFAVILIIIVLSTVSNAVQFIVHLKVDAIVGVTTTTYNTTSFILDRLELVRLLACTVSVSS